MLHSLLLALAVFANAQDVKIPRLIEGGYLSDPDKLLSKSERTTIKSIQKKLEARSGLKPIIAIQQNLPTPWMIQSDFTPSRAATRLLGVYAETWKEGSRFRLKKPKWFFGGKKTTPSVILFFATQSRAATASLPEDLVKKVFTPSNIKLYGQCTQEFFRVRAAARAARRKGVDGPGSPEYQGLLALLKMAQPIFQKLD